MRILLLACALPLLAQPNDNRLAVTSDAKLRSPPTASSSRSALKAATPGCPSPNRATIKPSPPSCKPPPRNPSPRRRPNRLHRNQPHLPDRSAAESREGYLIDHYRIHKTVAITLRDVSRFERLLSAVLTAGVNSLRRRLSNLRAAEVPRSSPRLKRRPPWRPPLA